LSAAFGKPIACKSELGEATRDVEIKD